MSLFFNTLMKSILFFQSIKKIDETTLIDGREQESPFSCAIAIEECCIADQLSHPFIRPAFDANSISKHYRHWRWIIHHVVGTYFFYLVDYRKKI